jgi:type II secretory pathway component PulJ
VATSENGFSLTELLVSTAITMTITAGVFTAMNPTAGVFQTQPEVVDLQQRLRVGVDLLRRDLMMAGAGASAGSHSGSLNRFFAPVQPSRMGFLASLDDPPALFRSDAVTLFHVPQAPTQTTLSQPLPTIRAQLRVNNLPGCSLKPLCGLEKSMQILVFDGTGSFDPLTVTDVKDNAGQVQRNRQGALSKAYAVGSTVVQARQHVYYLDTSTHQLMRYDGYQTAAPVVDNVVGLRFEYFGEPSPPVLRRPGIDESTTYGPVPPALDGTQEPWGAGENCTMTVVGGEHQPRLAALGAPGGGLVLLTAANLTDGPWCPTPDSPDRFDADLFRVRMIRVMLRLQAGNDHLRGVPGDGEDTLFARPGTSRGGYWTVPDREIRFDVSPRNLNLAR